MTNLFIPLKTEYFEAFKSGRKTVEYRPYGPRWNEKTCYVGRKVTLSKGYGKQARLTGTVIGFLKSDVPSRKMQAWKLCYGDRICDVACIRIKLDKKRGNK